MLDLYMNLQLRPKAKKTWQAVNLITFHIAVFDLWAFSEILPSKQLPIPKTMPFSIAERGGMDKAQPAYFISSFFRFISLFTSL